MSYWNLRPQKERKREKATSILENTSICSSSKMLPTQTKKKKVFEASFSLNWWLSYLHKETSVRQSMRPDMKWHALFSAYTCTGLTSNHLVLGWKWSTWRIHCRWPTRHCPYGGEHLAQQLQDACMRGTASSSLGLEFDARTWPQKKHCL